MSEADARPAPSPAGPTPTSHFLVGLARAAGGALVFALPLWMTEETWHLGYTLDPGRLALFLVLACPFLVALSHVAGFEPTLGLKDDVVDAAVAWAVGFATAAAGLALLGVIGPQSSWREGLGRVALQAVPGSIGALLAQSQFGGGGDAAQRPSTYASQLVVMLAGALFLAFNIAPTHEVELVAVRITPWHALALAAVSLAAMHGFVYALQSAGREPPGPDASPWAAFLRYTVPGYAIALLVSAYLGWTFGRLDGTALAPAVRMVVVLGFPASVGAAAARFLL
jgi:putative integral membrane protein (TIGR02587 family)